MASFKVDQAEGLRKLLEQPADLHVVTVFSVLPDIIRDSAILNLATALVRMQKKVLVVDASASAAGLPRILDMQQTPTVMDAIQSDRNVYESVRMASSGFAFANLASKTVPSAFDVHAEKITRVFQMIAKQADITLVCGGLSQDDTCPIPAMEKGEIWLHVSPGRASIQDAYLMLKRLHTKLMVRSFGILVTDGAEQEAKTMFMNLQTTAKRYLAVDLRFVGYIPKDDHQQRAIIDGNSVIKSFPNALASQAFLRIAQRLSTMHLTKEQVIDHASVGV